MNELTNGKNNCCSRVSNSEIDFIIPLEDIKLKMEEEYETNVVVVMNVPQGTYDELPEARTPTEEWWLYPIENEKKLLKPISVHNKSWYIFGRNRTADVVIGHKFCSKRHAILQYFLTDNKTTGSDNTREENIRPFLMDLSSTNGTFVNEERINAFQRVQLSDCDGITFGNECIQYILVNESTNRRIKAHAKQKRLMKLGSVKEAKLDVTCVEITN